MMRPLILRVLAVRLWQFRANLYAWRHGLPWGLCESDDGWRAAYTDGMTPAEYAGESVHRA